MEKNCMKVSRFVRPAGHASKAGRYRITYVDCRSLPLAGHVACSVVMCTHITLCSRRRTQGIKEVDGGYVLSDPALLTPSGSSGLTDMGSAAIQNFLLNHTCKSLCTALHKQLTACGNWFHRFQMQVRKQP